MKRLLATMLAVLMLITMLPLSMLSTSAAVSLPSEMTVLEDVESTLAPGITQHEVVVYDKNNNRVEMFVAEADTSVDTVNIYANYKDNQNTVYGMQKTTDQVAAAEANHEEPYNVVVAINASYYNTSNGKPTGAFVMEGNDVTTSGQGDAYPFFAVLKDGTVMIGAKGEYSSYKGQIQEAIGGWIHLVKDGAICSGLNSADKYPRQTVGLTEDGRVIIMTADGNQAPKSDGLTVQEQAEVMLAMGCVEALHLDGGGSATYCAKPEGSDTFQVLNSPSNGSERSVSNTLMFVSTAVADGTFDHATLSADNDYITPGSTATVNAIGVDAAGGAAEIPTEGIVWQLADSAMGTVENGVFNSNGTVGDAVIQMVYNGAVVGETTVHVVIPDGISFGREQIVIPYGSTVDANITLTYGVNEVKYNVSDLTLSLANATDGTIDGTSITSPSADLGITDSVLTVTLNADTSVTATVNIKYGKGSEVIFDFEDGTASANTDNWILRTHESDNNNNELGEISIVNAETGKVYSGDQALALHTDFSQTTCSGANTTGYHALSLGWNGDSISVKGAQSIGFWLYIPEDAMSTEITLNTFYYDANGVIQRRTKDAVDDNGEYIYTPYWSEKMEGSGWHYVSIDTSALTDDLFIHDEPGYTGGAYKRNFFIKIYAVTGPDTLTFPGHHGDFTYYIDDVTVDYSDAVEDRELPVFSTATVSGGATTKTLTYGEVAEFTENNAIFNAYVADNTSKTNYTGIDAASAKVYVDGVDVGAKYANGVISSENVELANGYHRVKFEIADNNGNVKYIIREFNVNYSADLPTVEFVAHDATLDRLLSGSVYWVDLTSEDIATLEKVETTINLNSLNSFELEHMVVNNGFDVSYTSTAAQDAEDIVDITFTRNDKALDADSNVIASIPVRVWESLIHTYSGHESKTPEYMWTAGNLQFKQVIVIVEKGIATFTDDTTSFSGNVAVDHESYTHYYNMDTTYHTEKGTYHVHTPVALDDVAATCTEDGYIGRTYCEECASVVDWGTTVEATGHSYILQDGNYVCETCGEGKSYTGLFEDTDGTHYLINGVAQSGWQMVNNEWYYFDTETLTGVDGTLEMGVITYELTNGKLNSGVWAKTLYGPRYYYGPDYYKNGWQEIDGKNYYFDGGYALYGGWQLTYENYQYRNWYYFNEDGSCDKSIKPEDGFYTDRNGLSYSIDGVAPAGVVEIDGVYYAFTHKGYAQKNGTYGGRLFKDDYAAYTGLHEENSTLYYYDNGKTGAYGLYKLDDGYYFVNWGGVVMTSGKYYVDTTLCDLPVGEYSFGEDGKMLDGVVNVDGTDYLYINGKTATYGLHEIDGNYYYSYWGGVVKTGKQYVGTTYCDIPAGEYVFGEDGKMLNGIVDVDGTLYYYVNGKTGTYGLFEIDGNYYYSYWGGVVKTGKQYVGTTYCDLPAGEYVFGEDGKMLNGIVDVDGTLYYYVNGRTGTYGLFEIDGNYYYSYWGGVVKTGKQYVGTTYCDLPVGEYVFGEDGKMLDGVVNVDGTDYLYINGKTATYGLHEIDGNYYYSYWGGVVKTGKQYVGTTYCDLPAGEYVFGEDGKMLNGIVDVDGTLYYYVNGKTGTYGLFEIDGNYYYSYWGGVVKTGKQYVGTTYCDLPAGEYVFGEDGKMLDGFVTKDDGIYYYENGKPGKLGLNYIDGYYYFVKNGDGLLVTNQTYYCWETNGLSMEMNYTFDELGRVIL